MVPSDDSFISEEEEEFCPLCVEEMDISDKNFKPCPCGYQICQFCYNNIRQNPELNGRCPACRRLYDDESVEYKSISAEEYRLQQSRREKREREKKQREKEKKENEMANKKHLAGLRVVQKNLVYVTGLNPPCSPDDLHSVLRSDKYFGQYGKISKIVINKKSPTGPTPGAPVASSSVGATQHHHSNPGLVVYVTFARKEDALKCINELDGSLCDGRILRAAHGTTKYCSSYLRGHPCPNPNCMFLHEPGEEADSYTRKDLSTQQGIKMGMMGMSGGNGGISSVSGVPTSSSARTGSSSNGNAYHSDHTSQNDYSGEEEELHFSTSEEEHHLQQHQQLHQQLQSDSAGLSSQPNVPILPATAHWAKGTSSASVSPAVNNNAALANAAAFPTLGEIFKEQQKQAQSKPKMKSSKSTKDNILLPDDIDIDDDSAIQFIEDTTRHLKNLSEKKEKLAVHFKKLSNSTSGRTLPLFAFNKSFEYANNTKLDEEKLIARQVIERFILRPIKNYHLAYQNHPISQQQILLQQQAQLQQQQAQQQAQQTPSIQAAQLQQLQLEQQKRLLEQQQQQHQGTPINSHPALNEEQSHQQHLLLQQLQQQQQQQQQLQYQQQQQQQQLQYSQAQLNMLKHNERSSNATPPPPGLFSGNKQAPPPPVQQVPQASNPSSSSQLLTQLMNGKK
ncbi:general negative regulator of transcription subunit 4 [[Candida] anglica]